MTLRIPLSCFLGSAVLLGALGLAAAADVAPRFEDYPVARMFTGPAKPLDLNSHPDARRYADHLIKVATGPADFAGKFRVATWECGPNCKVTALVDLSSGTVLMGPISSIGVAHEAGSALLVVNPPGELAKRYGTPLPPPNLRPSYACSKYFLWSDADKEFKLLYAETCGGKK